MFRRKLMLVVALLIVSGLVLTACGPDQTQIPLTQSPVSEPTMDAVPLATPTPEEVLPEPKTLIVCQSQEPDNLYLWGGAQPAAQHIHQAIYDGPIDNRTYTYQPIILEKLPSLADDDADLSVVIVQAGDLIVNAADEVVELVTGVQLRPAGCRNADCEVEFLGEPLQMDQMSATFVIQEGVQWSDGTPLTADDSVYSFELVGAPDTPVSRYTYTHQRTAYYEARDARTTVWTGLPGYIDNVYFTNFWPPLPRHQWQELLGYMPRDLVEAEESSRLPLGWGPFFITEWVAGDHITVERNPYYFRAAEGLPYVDRVIFRFVSDVNAAVVQLLSGDCDIVTQDVALTNQAELLLQMEEYNVLNLQFVTNAIWEHLDFGITPVETYERPNFFEDVRMRQAIAYCLDRQSVVDDVMYGRSQVIDTYIPPDHPLYADDRLTTYAYDPDQGRALLDEMGWVADADTGMRVAQEVEGVADGTQLAFIWASTTLPLRIQYMRLFQQNLADCGIQVDLQNFSAAEWFADGPTGPLFGRQFDVSSFAWLPDVEPSCHLYASWEIPSAENVWGGHNILGFSNEAYDVACRRALESLPGTDAYIEGHKEAQRIFSEQLPVIPLFLHAKLAVYRPEVVGFIMDSTEDSDLWNIEVFDLQR